VLNLKSATDSAWLAVVMADFDSFLLDHAACERKASATGMSFVVKYPDRRELIEPMIDFSREELEHFHRVYRVIAQRGLVLRADTKDDYVNALRARARSGAQDLFLDRLLIAGIVEARGCERLGIVAAALGNGEPELAALYADLTRAESRHHALFFRLARNWFDEETVRSRAEHLLDFEAELVARLPRRAAVH
jgi:tRNA-(ms[2]io[6]A)-hydroxylase